MWWVALIVIGAFALLIGVLVLINQSLAAGIKKNAVEADAKMVYVKALSSFDSNLNEVGRTNKYYVSFRTDDGKEYQKVLLGRDRETDQKYGVNRADDLTVGGKVRIIYNSKSPKHTIRIG